MPAAGATPSRKKARRLLRPRFGLRLAMAVLTLACVAFGFVAYRTQQRMAKEAAVIRFKELCEAFAPASVVLTHEEYWTKWRPEFYRDWLLGEFRSHDVVLLFLGTPAEGGSRSELKRLIAEICRRDAIANLDLNCARVSGRDLLRITESCSNLEFLGLDQTDVGDDGLRDIAERCPRLEWVSVISTEVTDVGLQELGKLEHLSELRANQCRIDGTAFSDASLNGLWRNLEHIELQHCRLTDWGVASVLSCPSLQRAYIGHNAVTFDGLLDAAKGRSVHLQAVHAEGMLYVGDPSKAQDALDREFGETYVAF